MTDAPGTHALAISTLLSDPMPSGPSAPGSTSSAGSLHDPGSGANGVVNGASRAQPAANPLADLAAAAEHAASSRDDYIKAQDARLRAVAEFERATANVALIDKVAADTLRYTLRLDAFDAFAYAELAPRAASRAVKAARAKPAVSRTKKKKAESTKSAAAASDASAAASGSGKAASSGASGAASGAGASAAGTPAPEEGTTTTGRRRKRKASEEPASGRTKVRAVEKASGGRASRKPKKDEAEIEAEAEEKDKAKAAKKSAGTAKQYASTYESIWRDIARKEVPKAFKLYQSANSVKLANAKKTAVLASKEARRWQFRSNKVIKDMQSKARRSMREMMAFWKRNEKEERDLRRRAEKEALESARRDEEARESRRQAKKLNFLITQTELYSHFVGSKIKTSELEGDMGDAAQPSRPAALDHINGQANGNGAAPQLTSVGDIDFDNADDAEISRAAHHNAEQAVLAARERAQEFDESHVRKVEIDDDEMNFQNPTSLGDITIAQPKLLTAKLKEYQLKGLNWLANLYDQGINGILADEMGLGKTVQSISVMAYLAETHNIWGPFLVIAPASTLHNWQQEITKFVPDFKVLPYWGNNKDRKVLRKFWDRKQLRYDRDSPFHVLVTSYQLVVADAQYFNRVKWQYMILDEAQAIKSSSSSRWKSLLSMQSRNRLLLTGTPIQNSMQELWALLHFIMPTLFDSHEEFSDWFSKDIESHATKNSKLNDQQLKRLHMILKPFMLRRVKKHVQQELGDKIEIDVYCNLTHRQRVLYQTLRSQISLRDLLERTANDDTQSLMNLVMQFRKVCNHPDLFERADVRSPFTFGTFGNTIDYSREGAVLDLAYTTHNAIEYSLPKKLYREGLLLDEPGPDSDASTRRKIENLFTVWDASSTTMKAFEKISDTPAGRIIREAKQGLFERALGNYRVDPIDDKKLELFNVANDFYTDHYIGIMEPGFHEPVSAAPIDLVGPDRSLTYQQTATLFPQRALQALTPLTLNQEWDYYQKGGIQSIPPNNLYPSAGRSGFSNVEIPSMSRFVTDSGKLSRLDSLLAELKAGGHRVLIYFQMTKMMDLVEEYLTYRQFRYCRLDGSSKLSDRRDLVNDWQTKPELFVFLLSTRAGGLGINLTAADTVIFYDSDWNPTIDSQAMDRAHRLGQTRQVTVYRLLVKGTIEERMRDRAKQKEHVQQVVMEGGGRGQQADFQKPGREVAYWLLDDDNAVSEAIQRQEAQQKQSETTQKKRGRKKQQPVQQPSLEDMYHEQEGNFENKS